MTWVSNGYVGRSTYALPAHSAIEMTKPENRVLPHLAGAGHHQGPVEWREVDTQGLRKETNSTNFLSTLVDTTADTP